MMRGLVIVVVCLAGCVMDGSSGLFQPAYYPPPVSPEAQQRAAEIRRRRMAEQRRAVLEAEAAGKRDGEAIAAQQRAVVEAARKTADEAAAKAKESEAEAAAVQAWWSAPRQPAERITAAKFRGDLAKFREAWAGKRARFEGVASTVESGGGMALMAVVSKNRSAGCIWSGRRAGAVRLDVGGRDGAVIALTGTVSAKVMSESVLLEDCDPPTTLKAAPEPKTTPEKWVRFSAARITAAYANNQVAAAKAYEEDGEFEVVGPVVRIYPGIVWLGGHRPGHVIFCNIDDHDTIAPLSTGRTAVMRGTAFGYHRGNWQTRTRGVSMNCEVVSPKAK